jgi:hypothetical protein
LRGIGERGRVRGAGFFADMRLRQIQDASGDGAVGVERVGRGFARARQNPGRVIARGIAKDVLDVCLNINSHSAS